ncbi:MAG: class I SAM-dependent methyltransferase [Defluviitaleaceae bacterium]|nr:class I SAM-dependent methyltransferase [Defluviitaleaceae bacterium]
MDNYWDGVWNDPETDKYIGYVKGYATWNPEFMEIFAKHGVRKVCDAACGFGAYSVMMAKKGYEVSGFDISEKSVALTLRMLKKFECTFDEYKVCGITDIKYGDDTFCAIAAHAVIDHLPFADAKIALAELYRVLKPGGLLYLSFDPLGEDDIQNAHTLLDDGSRLYNDGLRFRYYSEDDISLFLMGREIIYSNSNRRGEREYILQK